MDDLAAFLRARLDEKEAAAKAAQAPSPWKAATDESDSWIVTDATGEPLIYDEGTPSLEEAAHIALNDPARALREVEAGRALLRMHEPVPFWGNNPPPLKDRTPENAVAWYCECQCPDGMIQGAYPCDTARLLAAVHSGHPGYRQEWKP